MRINKYIGALILALGLAVPAVSVAAECEYGTKARLEEIYTEAQKEFPEMVRRALTDREVQQVFDAVGRPPNAGAGVLEVERVDLNGTTTLVFTQGECFINKIGPLPTDLLDMQFGFISAKGEKVD